MNKFICLLCIHFTKVHGTRDAAISQFLLPSYLSLPHVRFPSFHILLSPVPATTNVLSLQFFWPSTPAVFTLGHKYCNRDGERMRILIDIHVNM